MSILAVVPARMGSSRFPGKPLELIEGIAMIEHVFINVSSSKYINNSLIATENNIIYKKMKERNINCIITQKHPTCTDRVSEVSTVIDEYDYILNLQGDEPLLKIESINKFIELSVELFKNESVQVTNAITKLKPEEIKDPNRVKAIVQNNIITDLSRTKKSEWKQLGLYMYRTETIKLFNNLPTEDRNKLDTLRFTENNIDVYAIPIETNSLSVDTPEDLKIVRQIFLNRR